MWLMARCCERIIRHSARRRLPCRADAAGSSGAGSSGAGSSGAGGSGGSKAAEPAGMRMYLSQIREWVSNMQWRDGFRICGLGLGRGGAGRGASLRVVAVSPATAMRPHIRHPRRSPAFACYFICQVVDFGADMLFISIRTDVAW